MVGAEVLNFALECGVVFTNECPIYKISKLCTFGQKKFIFGGDSGVVVANGTSMKRTRMGTAATVSSKKFRKGSMEIIRNKGGNDVLFTVGDDKEMTGTGRVEVVLPSRTWEDAWLRTVRTRSSSFSISVHGLGFQCNSLGLLV